MTQYCTNLYTTVNGSHEINWLLGIDETGLKSRMRNLFATKTWPEEKLEMFVEDAVGNLVGSYPLLEYFQDYLVKHLTHDLQDFNNAASNKGVINIVNGDDVVKSVQTYIAGKVPTALVLGGCTDPNADDNSDYPNMDKYIYQNQRKIDKVQAQDIMSPTNVLKEVVFAVQSTKFISECNSFEQMKNLCSSDDLFKMEENAEFVALSNLVVNPGDHSKLNVNWLDVKRWLFESNPDNCSDEKMLKAFIKTQIYRPLFFKYNNYEKFTSNESAYYCSTDKSFIDHDGNEHRLTFDSEQNLIKSNVKTILESQEISHGEYTVPVDSINYFPISNKFEYSINYNPVQIVDNKFVINDVEFYVVRPNPGSAEIDSIYFNEFQSNTEGQNQVAKVTDNKFKLNGMDYVIEGNEISIDAATKVFDETKDDANHGKYKEWKCDIVDDRFQFDGIWYVLAKNGSNQYVSVGYADNKDNKLVSVLVTEGGHAYYRPWNISFQLTSDWQKVQVVKKHQSDVIDRLKEEWCEFDG